MPPSPASFHREHLGKLVYSCLVDGPIWLGFSEGRWPREALKRLFVNPPLWLKQVHTSHIHFAEQSQPGMEGDGWIVRTPDLPVVIQTADCVPLFFWSEKDVAGGILHIGWRGWQLGIERNLLDLLKKSSLTSQRFQFLLGPAIEGSCYPVGEDVHRAFARVEWAHEVFTPTSQEGRYTLDLKMGIRRSLEASGIKPGQIDDCGLCTRCQGERFPSYRRDGKTGERIFSFLMIRPPMAGAI